MSVRASERWLTVGLVLGLAVLTGWALLTPPRRGEILPAEFAKTVYSQCGEDGILEKIFEVVPPTTRYVIEFGAGDGVTFSNARRLILHEGWRGLLIEGDEERAATLARNYAGFPGVRTVRAWVFPGNVELLFEENGAPRDLDLLVIDIDSNDYYVWRALHTFRPKVVMIEANLRFPPPQLMVIDFHPMNYWDQTPYHGASVQSYYNLAKKKGYELIYCMQRGPNVFFVDKQYFDRFGIADNSPSKLYRRQIQAKTPLIPPGKERLHWDAFDIEKKFLHHR